MLKNVMIASLASLAISSAAHAMPDQERNPSCAGLPTSEALKPLHVAAVKKQGETSGGAIGFNSWAVVVAPDGIVCAISYSGVNYTDQWLAGRVSAAQKASTANGFSQSKVTPGSATSTGSFALSSANLYAASQEGGFLYGLNLTNVADTNTSYFSKDGKPGDATTFGTNRDPMIGRPIGGVVILGGGLALYNAAGVKVGGLGVGGDTGCSDHVVAWHLRHNLNLDFLKTGGVAGIASLFLGDVAHPDNIIFDLKAAQQTSFGHPVCLFNPPIDPATNTLTFLEPVQ